MTTPPSLDDAAGVIVVADDPLASAAAAEAVGVAGMRLLDSVSWREARERIARHVAPATLLIEAKGVGDDTIARTLPDLVALVAPTRIVVAFDGGQLDQIGSILIGTEAALLHDAVLADRVAALVMAQCADAIDVRDNREETARLARINAEVARFTEKLAQLTGTSQDAAIERTGIVGDRRIDFAQPVVDIAVTAVELRRAIRARRLRDEVFGTTGLFEDPAWDMMLDLFAADLEQRQVSVSSLCIAAAVAPTTALRWINKLIEVGLFERRPDAFDRRRAYVALTQRALAALHDYVAALRRAGLSIA